MPKPDSALLNILKGSLVFALLAGMTFAVNYFDAAGLLNSSRFQDYVRANYAAGAAVFVLLSAVCSALAVPRQALAFAAGYLFGALPGLAWVNLGASIGCAASFFYARSFGRRQLKKLLGKKLDPLNNFLKKAPLGATLTLRLLPVGHNATTNVLAGLSQIPPLPFIAGSFLGYIPQHLIFSLLGSGVQLSPALKTGAAGALFALSSLLGYFLYRKRHKPGGLAQVLDAEGIEF